MIVRAAVLVFLLSSTCSAQFVFDLYTRDGVAARLELSKNTYADLDDVVDFQLLPAGIEVFGDLDVEFNRSEGLFFGHTGILSAEGGSFLHDDDLHFDLYSSGIRRLQRGPQISATGTWLAVPEPSGLSLLAIGVVVFSLRSRLCQKS